MNIILWHEGKENGPYDLETLKNAVVTGDVSPQMLARADDGTEWKPLEALLPKKVVVKPPRQLSKLPAKVIRKLKIAGVAAITLAVLMFAFVFVMKARYRRAQALEVASAIERSRQAFNELSKLQSATVVGVNFPDFSKRLLDTKAAFDVAIRKAQDDSETLWANEHLTKAMNHYILSRKFWNFCIADGGTSANFSPEEASAYAQYKKLGVWDGLGQAHDVKFIWAFADDELEKADDELRSLVEKH